MQMRFSIPIIGKRGPVNPNPMNLPLPRGVLYLYQIYHSSSVIISQCSLGSINRLSTPIAVWCDATIIVYLLLSHLIMYYFVFRWFWLWYVLQCFCDRFLVFLHMAIDVSVQYNGGLLLDTKLLTICYYHHRGTRLNAIEMFCFRSL